MSVPLAARLREATRLLHTEVERAGVMRQLLRGEIALSGYVALLRNLHPIYAELERGLARHGHEPALSGLVSAPMLRTEAIAADLDVLHAGDWAAGLPLAPAAADYARHLAQLADTAPVLLAAHAYVRYLGDLSGGQMLARVVGRRFGLQGPEGLCFYAFGSVDDVAVLAADFRAALDQMAPDEAAAQALVDEACSAFVRHRDLFEQLAPSERAASLV
jgi:heme oxygenase (biliverdin-producing, ferredoxin)